MKFFKIALAFFFILIGSHVFAQSSADLKRQLSKYNEELAQLNHELEETTNNKRSTLHQLDIIRSKINVLQQQIDNINSQVRNLDSQITENTNTVHSLQSHLEQLKKEYAGMVLFAYRNHSAYNKLMFIFAARDFNQAYKRLKYLQQFGAYRERQADYIQSTQKDLGVKIVRLSKDKDEKHSLLVDQEKQRATLAKEKKDEQQAVAALSKHSKLIGQQMQEVQDRVARTKRAVNAAVQREIEEARRKAEEAERLAAKK